MPTYRNIVDPIPYPLENAEQFKQAYRWNGEQIANYLRRICQDKSRSRGSGRLTELERAFNRLWNSLDSPTADRLALYKSSKPEIDQDLWYPWNEDNDQLFDKMSIIICEYLIVVGFILSETLKLPIKTSNPGEYCRPLLAMYGKWCLTLCPRYNKQRGLNLPTKASIAYAMADGQIQKIVLGTCIAGTPADNNVTNIAAVRREIFMDEICQTAGTAPMMKNPKDQCKFDWGRCAEFYPYFLLKSSKTPKSVRVKTVRLRTTELFRGLESSSQYEDTVVNGAIAGPCDNCREVFDALKADPISLDLDKCPQHIQMEVHHNHAGQACHRLREERMALA